MGPEDIKDNLPDNYVSHILETEKPLPPVEWKNLLKEINYLGCSILLIPPIIGIYGALQTPLKWKTFWFGLFWMHVIGTGLTAGYHRYWSHRAYNATKSLQYVLAAIGAGTVQGSIKWWCRGHRAHHRYTDTDLDPYNARRGLVYSHLGWMLLKPRRKPGIVDVSDLINDPVVRWQHRYYGLLASVVALGIPTLVPWYFWDDAQGGFYYAGIIRMILTHHATFCINSLAHYMGERRYDDEKTSVDSFWIALISFGEGYHNFHHQFPMDYRNGYEWYNWDIAKWFIWSMHKIGLVTHLKMFPDNEVSKAKLAMRMKKLRKEQEAIEWPCESNKLPVISWDDFQEQAKTRSLVLIAGFIHNVTGFIDEHPGGSHFLTKMVGKDATAAFFGGVYGHSNAAHNLLSMKRVGILDGGYKHGPDEKSVPPGQQLRIARYNEIPFCRE